MDAAENLAADRFKPITWAEICERYPDQHVCLVDVDRIHPRGLEFRTARVIGHGNTFREAADHARQWRDRFLEIAFRFTGRSKSPLVRPTLILDDETRDAIRYRR